MDPRVVIAEQVSALKSQRTTLVHERDAALARAAEIESEFPALNQNIDALERALAVLEEQLPARDEAPKERSPEQRELDEALRRFHDPLRVVSRDPGVGHRRRSPRQSRGHVWAGTAEVPKDEGIVKERADFVLEIMLDLAEPVSQWDLSKYVMDFFECEKFSSASGIVSDSLAVLQERGVVTFTGEKVGTDNTDRRVSPVWDVVHVRPIS